MVTGREVPAINSSWTGYQTSPPFNIRLYCDIGQVSQAEPITFCINSGPPIREEANFPDARLPRSGCCQNVAVPAIAGK